MYWEIFRGYLCPRAGSTRDNVGIKGTNFRGKEVPESGIGSAQLGVMAREDEEWNVSNAKNLERQGNARWGPQDRSRGSGWSSQACLSGQN